MADPLSIVGTVAGLVVLGAKLACKATTFVGDVSSASEDIGAVLTELHALCGVLSKLERLLRDELKQGTGQGVIPTELSADLSLVLDSCMDLFVKLQLFLERYSTKQGNGLLAVKWKQMKWVIKEKDLKNLRVGLAAHKATLNVTLGLASWCVLPYSI